MSSRSPNTVEFLRELLSLSSFLDEMHCLIEMVIASLESWRIVNDDFLVLNTEHDSLIDIVFLSLVIKDANLSILFALF